MPFERFEHVRAQRGTTYATIDKYGRLLVPQVIAERCGLKVGDLVELYFDPQTRDIGIKQVKEETFYTVKVSSTGPLRADGKRHNCVIPVLTMLHAYGITLVHKLKGQMGILPDGMLVFKIGEILANPLPNNAAIVDRGLAALYQDGPKKKRSATAEDPAASDEAHL